MGQIIQICKRSLSIAAIAVVISSSPASALVDDRLDDYARAWVSELSLDHKTASDEYAILLKNDPSNVSIAQNLWTSAIYTGDYKKALKAAKILEKNGNTAEVPFFLFADALSKKQWDNARATIEVMREKEQYGFLIPLFESWLGLGQGKPVPLPETEVASIFSFYSNDQTILMNLAQKNYTDAKSELRMFIGADVPYAHDLRLRTARVFAANNDRVFAALLTKRLVSPDIEASFIAPKQKGRDAKITSNDALAQLYTRLGNALLEQDLPEKALAVARIALWQVPNHDPAKLVLGRAYGKLGIGEKEITSLSQIALKSPYWDQAQSLKVASLTNSNRQAEAVNIAQNAHKQRNSLQTAILLGQSQREAKQYSQSAATFANILQNAEESNVNGKRRALFHLQLAMVLHDDNKWQNARVELDKGLILDPLNPFLLNYLGYSLLERKEEIKPAIEMIQKAHRLAPSSMAITDSLGWGYFLTGDYSNAVSYLEKAARGSKNDVTINEHLGDAYWKVGRLIDARYAWGIAELHAQSIDKPRLAHKIDYGLDVTFAEK